MSHLDTPREQWSHAVSDCHSSKSLCLLGAFLPCLLFGRGMSRLRDEHLENYSYFNADCCRFCFCGCIALAIQRNAIRERFNISGTKTGDCVFSTCCPWCALVQHDREVDTRRRIDMGYQLNPMMQY
ncbi:PLAC8 family-domain-containing protein [Aspergillus ambiguus]|uniref:PLAC8 family protein n=1 Tax=Aspergillus ambiguus TaxID=176160 RepID=UPI003CCCD5D6